MKGYRINWPEEHTAWKALNFEYDELSNWHLLTELADFLGINVSNDEEYHPVLWAELLVKFRSRYGDAEGIWLTRTKAAAVKYYGEYGGDILEYEYNPRLIISDLGEDGIFVLRPRFIN